MLQINRALLLYNGNAGAQTVEKKLAQTLPILSQGIKELTVIQTHSLDELKEVCKEWATAIDVLIVLGGDGTVHAVINCIAGLDIRPAIALLPGGTSNDFSRTLRMPQNLKAAAQSIINGTLQNVDVCHANQNYFLNFWGIGLVTEASKNIDEAQKNNLGVLSYFISSLKSIRQTKAFSYRLKANGKAYAGEAILIFVLNGRYIGTKEVPINNLSPQDGKADVLIIKNSNLESLRELFALNNQHGHREELEALEHFQAEEIEIETNSVEEADMDGEIYTSTPASIAVIPSHLRMIYGK
ncbi:diacylglycerol/lipid kinase family protein [Virgibacillus sp. W0430]|uniref:diacylglycerol/lipid kinase family protein n=1 Tax=Virgibacillus sp. W0430 TaxID=3391580 RepID=UPI003F48B091